jgi:hypothetical protein
VSQETGEDLPVSATNRLSFCRALAGIGSESPLPGPARPAYVDSNPAVATHLSATRRPSRTRSHMPIEHESPKPLPVHQNEGTPLPLDKTGQPVQGQRASMQPSPSGLNGGNASTPRKSCRFRRDLQASPPAIAEPQGPQIASHASWVS